MAQVSAAPRTEDLGARAKEGPVGALEHGSRLARVKAGPAAAGVELLLAREEVLTTTCEMCIRDREWDLAGLLTELQIYSPTTLNVEALSSFEDIDDVIAVIVDEAVGLYEKKCEEYPGGVDTAKDIERDVMLQILDQRWRCLLYTSRCV